MNASIIRGTDTERQVWEFWLDDRNIYWQGYAEQTKRKRQRRWATVRWWSRLSHRGNTIERPELPADVEAEMREKFAVSVKALPIVR